MREIKQIDAEHIDDYMEIYLNAYPAYKELDDACELKYREKVLRDMARQEDVDFIGCFEEEKLVAVMKMVNFKMNLYGQMHPAVGLMSMAVHPLHKKKAIALDMMKFYEAYTRKKKALVAVLLPFSFQFYRKMGYGLGARMDEYHLETRKLPSMGDTSSLKFLSSKDMDRILECNQRMVEKNHGMLQKFSEEIWEMRQDEVARRIGYEEDGQLKGYLAYRFEDAHESNYTQNRILVDELVYESGPVLKSLLTYLQRQADLAQTVVLRSGEEDFYHLLLDPQDQSMNYIPFGYLQTNISAIGNMYKVMDPEQFVEATKERSFPQEELTIAFNYKDELEGEDREFLLCFKEGSWSSSKRSPDVTVTCSQGDLSSLLLNASRFSSLVRLGVMDISDPTYIEPIDRLLYSSQKPFSNNDF